MHAAVHGVRLGLAPAPAGLARGRCGRQRWRCRSRKGEEEGRVVSGMRRLLQGDSGHRAATDLVTSIDQQGRAALLSALFCSAASDQSSADVQFQEADTNADGMLDREEFANYVEAQKVVHGLSAEPLTTYQLFNLGVRSAIGMVGFGFIDNAVMITAGDAIQNSIGSVLGLSTLASAGLGNAVSDLLGTALCSYIQGASSAFMPALSASSLQLSSQDARWAETTGSSVGITVGCLLGMVPLLLVREEPPASPDGSKAPPISPRSQPPISNSVRRPFGAIHLQQETLVTISPPPPPALPHCSRLHQAALVLAFALAMALKRLCLRWNHKSP